MPDYAKTKIYYLDVQGDRYYGHTTQTLSERKSKHNSIFKVNTQQKVYKAVHDAGLDMKHVPIVFVENFPCNDVNEAKARERYFIDKAGVLNSDLPLRTLKEWREANKDLIKVKRKQKYLLNGEKIRLRSRIYRQLNKHIINSKQREQYRENGKQKQHEYRSNNIDKVRELKRGSYQRCKQTYRDYEINNKEAIKFRKQNWYRENKDKLQHKLDQHPELKAHKKQQIQNWNKKRIVCDVCGIEMSQGWLNRHKKKQHPCEG